MQQYGNLLDVSLFSFLISLLFIFNGFFILILWHEEN